MAQHDGKQTSIPSNDYPKVKSVRLWDAILYPGLGSTSELENSEKMHTKLEMTSRGIRATLQTNKDKTARLLFPWAAIAFIEEGD